MNESKLKMTKGLLKSGLGLFAYQILILFGVGFVMINILRREALYFNNKSHILLNMSDKLEYVFELILKGEYPDQRKPGVPRII